MALFVAFAFGVNASHASAQSMNLTPDRLRIEQPPTGCSASLSFDPRRAFCSDNAAWRSIGQQFGVALASPVLHGAATSGPDGFYVGLEGTVTGISQGADYWARGTRGSDADLATGRNENVPPVLYWQRLAVRKGLPFGFEVGSSIGHLFGTSYVSLGADLKFALFEGFHHDWGAFVPDVAVRGSVQTMFGASQTSIVVPSVDLTISKSFSVAGAGTITPLLGAQVLWVVVQSEVVDLTPEVDAYAVQRDTGNGDDFTNNGVFPDFNALRSRGFFGLEGRYRALSLSTTVMFDLSKPPDAGAATPLDLARQWSWNFAVGLTM